MKRLNYLFISTVLMLCMSCSSSSVEQRTTSEEKISDKDKENPLFFSDAKARASILFLSKGNIYSYNFGEESRQTKLNLPGDSIMDFYLSPSKQYIAYTVLQELIPIVFEEEIDGYNYIGRIIIYDLTNKKIVKELYSQEDVGLMANGWVSQDKLFFDEAAIGGPLALCAYAVGDAKPEIIDFSLEEDYRSRILSPDATLMAFIDAKSDLHIVDQATEADNVFRKNNERITDMAFSNGNKALAVLTVANDFDVVSIFDIQKKSETVVYEKPAEAKTAINALCFSTDNSFLSIDINFKTHIVNLATKKTISIDGFGSCWIDASKFVYIEEPSKDMYVYDLSSGNRSLIAKNVGKIEIFDN